MNKKICDRCGADARFDDKIQCSTLSGKVMISKDFCEKCHREIWSKIHGLMFNES